jgi:hypothetical protein
MTEPIHSYSGETISEWLERLPNELPVDAVGMWQIVPALRRAFGFNADELIEHTRAAILALLSKGARPVVGATDGLHFWSVRNDFVGTDEDIAQAAISEWLASGRDPDPGDLWFALPELYEATRSSTAGESTPRTP